MGIKKEIKEINLRVEAIQDLLIRSLCKCDLGPDGFVRYECPIHGAPHLRILYLVDEKQNKKGD